MAVGQIAPALVERVGTEKEIFMGDWLRKSAQIGIKFGEWKRTSEVIPT